MGNTVLVTGAGGFVGGHVIEELLAVTGHHVIATDSFRHNGAVDRLVEAIGGDASRVDVETHDLTVPFSGTQTRRLADVDAIVNVASRCHVGESIAEPREYVLNNVALVVTVLELARTLNVQRFVHVSTDEVYGPHDPSSWTDHRPSSPYAASKAAQEDVCHAYARTYGVPTTVVNSANMFGERQSRAAFIPRLVDAITADEVVEIDAIDGTPGRRNYSYVRNVARRLVANLNEPIEPTNVTRLSLAGQLSVDNLELARAVAKLTGRELRHRLRDATSVRPGYDQQYGWMISSTGWLRDVEISVLDGLRTTVQWLMQHRGS